jgi:hypothetical protein
MILNMKRVSGLILFVMCSVVAHGQDRPVQPDLPGDISIDVGWTMLSNNPDFFETKVFSSRTLGLHYMYPIKMTDRFIFNPAIGIGMDRLGMQDNVNFTQDDQYNYNLDTIQGLGLRKNLLMFTYVELPVEIRYYPFKTVEGEGFFVSAGAFIGARIGSQTKVKYDFLEETRTTRDKADYGLSDLRYGFQARLGWKPISIFYKHYLNDLFQIEPFGADPQQFTFGLNFTGF